MHQIKGLESRRTMKAGLLILPENDQTYEGLESTRTMNEIELLVRNLEAA